MNNNLDLLKENKNPTLIVISLFALLLHTLLVNFFWAPLDSPESPLSLYFSCFSSCCSPNHFWMINFDRWTKSLEKQNHFGAKSLNSPLFQSYEFDFELRNGHFFNIFHFPTLLWLKKSMNFFPVFHFYPSFSKFPWLKFKYCMI